jgi:hypothetical protein
MMGDRTYRTIAAAFAGGTAGFVVWLVLRLIDTNVKLAEMTAERDSLLEAQSVQQVAAQREEEP